MAGRRTALVTGGASGIGLACVERLRAAGTEVVTLDRDPSADFVADVTDLEALAGVVREAPHIDVIVNSAGVVGLSAPFLQTTSAAWRLPMEVNLFGAVNVMHAFIPGMVERGWGRVVNIASVAGKEGTPGLAAYSASKGALIAATKSIGKELAETGVLVNAIAPGTIQTPMLGTTEAGVIAHTMSLIPMKRTGQPKEVAELVAWLASDALSFSTGAVYDISGGRATY
ncbi:SDR family NAD(P)-dependent oxidoreductase [Agromyces sp. NPDC049794]|uniref:SDR family NAD(P)-dependent oxidoreductase n=1 Tax=unclassified Agromyces TaxID=2639701 RepID=UPI0033F3327D